MNPEPNSPAVPRVTTNAQSGANRHTRRWIPWFGAVLLVALIIVGLWPKPVAVEIARAAVGPLRSTVNEEGKTRIKQRYLISAPVAGQLRRIPFKAGAEIQSGQVVAVIDPLPPTLLDVRSRSQAEARRDTAAATVEKARAAHNFASSELQRFQRLYADKTISVQELEAAQMRETTAAKEAAAAEGDLRQAEAELTYFSSNSDQLPAHRTPRELTSPVAGRVLKVIEESARVVASGTPLLEIGDPSDLEVVVEVLSRDGAAIRHGAKIEFDQWGGADPLQGRVRLVEPAAFTKISALGVEEQRVNVIADLLTPPDQRTNVGDQFRVEARIITWESQQTLKVPAGALFRRGDQWAAFAVRNGHAHLRTVKIGASSGTETQILDGLQSGDEVILYPSSKVKDGQRVEPITI